MGTIRLSAWSAASSARGFLSSAREWRGRRCHHAPLAPCRRHAPSSPPWGSAAPSSSLVTSPLRVWTEHEWLWDCRRGDIGGSRRDYAKEMQVAVRVVQVACTLCQRVQDSLLSDFGSGRVHSKLDRSPVTVAVSRKQPLRVYSMVKYAAIARGDAEIFMKFARFEYKEKIWDHAVGVVIIQEAGGMITDAGGRPLDFSRGVYLDGLDRGTIACSGALLHQRILEAVDASWNSSTL